MIQCVATAVWRTMSRASIMDHRRKRRWGCRVFTIFAHPLHEVDIARSAVAARESRHFRLLVRHTRQELDLRRSFEIRVALDLNLVLLDAPVDRQDVLKSPIRDSP